jgi:prevent-host-death family protein
MTTTIAAGEFKSTCLKLLDAVSTQRETLIITKRGKPVAQLIPIPVARTTPLFGASRGRVLEEGDLVSPLENNWNACQ